MTTPKVLRLADVQNAVAGPLVTAKGVRHDVRQLDFDAHQALQQADDATGIDVLRSAVGRVVPTMTPEEIGALTVASAQAILMLAGAGIAAVEGAFPNAVGPETTQTSPA